jgi:pseudouridine synthase
MYFFRLFIPPDESRGKIIRKKFRQHHKLYLALFRQIIYSIRITCVYMKARLQKIISQAGICSRRKAEELINLGKVKVNGRVSQIGDSADPDSDEISVNGKKVGQEKKRYIMMNKPKGYICELGDRRGRKTVYSLLEIKERVYTVGRLDIDSEGLLLLTNDGDFANSVAHPRYEIDKVYEVEIKNELEEGSVRKMKSGLILSDGPVRDVMLSRISHKLWLVKLHEGRKHIVKRIFEAVGNNVVRLKRVAVGGLFLGQLKPGKYREIKSEERRNIFAQNGKKDRR